ncbi:putative transmembrane protein [Toxoplasma gondii RUB]|uniref:Putative transmembrane protein n=1 Tax=Toxoplasma gondii RUB TaxID=935652 RepID=A0A086M092_TOXGO|nr:putative transmembrane protein [Toxoplasma gondii RUB]
MDEVSEHVSSKCPEYSDLRRHFEELPSGSKVLWSEAFSLFLVEQMLEEKDSLLHSFALFCSLLCPDSKLRFLQATVHLVNSCLGKVASTRSTALPLRRLSYLVSPRQSPLFSFFCSSVSLLLLPAFDSSLIVSLPLKTATYRPTVSPAVSLSLLLCLSLSLLVFLLRSLWPNSSFLLSRALSLHVHVCLPSTARLLLCLLYF